MTGMLLECSGVGKRSATGDLILDSIDFAVAPGRTVALMGANGAGKTTLLDIVCGLTAATAGRVRIAGHSPREAVESGSLGGMLQSGGLLPEITVAETVDVVAALFGVSRPGDLIDRVGLRRLADRRVSACSGGEQQWVKWTLAQIPEPKLFVLDEPTAGMDWQARRRFWQEVAEHRERGSAVLYATHYADEVEGVADEIVLLDRGRVAALTTPDQARDAARGEDAQPLFDGLARLIDERGRP